MATAINIPLPLIAEGHSRTMARGCTARPFAVSGDMAETPQPSAGAALTASVVRNRVLIIDDDDAVRQVFQRLLESAGFDVAGAAGGAEGLQRLREDPFIGLVLLDLNMPDVDGRSVRRAQRADPQLHAIPTVVVTGSADRIVDEELQAADYLHKPVSRERLLAVVQSYCDPVHADRTRSHGDAVSAPR